MWVLLLYMWGRILFLATRKLVCPLWGAKPARFCSQYQVWEDSGCSPTSARDAPRSYFISPWSKHVMVVVHSCLLQGLIKYEWGASLADVGLHLESSHTWYWEQNRAGLAPQSGQTSLQVARNKILPHNIHYNIIFYAKLFNHIACVCG